MVSCYTRWLAEDPQATPTQGIVEFKNPHTCINLMIDDAISAKKCTCLVINNERKSLKTTHDYYYQVQTLMLCSGTRWCNFFLRTTVDMYCERIDFDEKMCVLFYSSKTLRVLFLYYLT